MMSSSLKNMAEEQKRAALARINQEFIATITRLDITQAEHDAALHHYLTRPDRPTPAKCYCPKCK